MFRPLRPLNPYVLLTLTSFGPLRPFDSDDLWTLKSFGLLRPLVLISFRAIPIFILILTRTAFLFLLVLTSFGPYVIRSFHNPNHDRFVISFSIRLLVLSSFDPNALLFYYRAIPFISLSLPHSFFFIFYFFLLLVLNPCQSELSRSLSLP